MRRGGASRLRRPLTRRAWLRLVGLGAAPALLGGYSVLVERYLIGINTYRIPVPRLPPAFEGLRIVHLTDLHLDALTPLSWLEQLLARATRLQGDLIALTGDYVHARSTAAPVDQIWPSIARLRAPLGVFNVLGNHDHWANARRSLEWLEASGQSVRHRARPIERGGDRLWIAGAGDLWEDASGIDGALADAPESDCRIVLAHNPDTADLPREARVDLMISGHTHGGQVRLPGGHAPVLPVRNKRYSSGLVEGGKTRIFISRGIGWAILPIRLNCRPEIAVLELVGDSTIRASRASNPQGTKGED